MKAIKWKTLIITGILCLLPILLGVYLWDILPDEIAVHFNLYIEPDGFASKGFAVFGIPLIMCALQIFGCIISDFKVEKYGAKVPAISKWIVPVISIVVQAIILIYALENAVI